MTQPLDSTKSVTANRIRESSCSYRRWFITKWDKFGVKLNKLLVISLQSVLVLSLAACTTVPASTPSVALSIPSTTPALKFTPSPTITPTSTPVPTYTSTAPPTPIPILAGFSISVSDPMFSNPELFDLSQPDAPIPEFVNAMKIAGIELNGEQVLRNLTYREVKGKDTKPYVLGVFTPQGTQFESPIPLFISSQNEETGAWFWERCNPRNLANKIGIEIGSSIYPEEGLYDDPGYRDRVSQFNAISVVQLSHYLDYRKTPLQKPNLLRVVKKLADTYGLNVMFGNLFWSVQYPEEATKEPEKAMRELLQILFSNKMVGDKREYDYFGGTKPLRVILNHELIGATGSGNIYWTPDDPYYQAFHGNVLIKSLSIAIEESQRAGLKLNEDVVFYYGGDTAETYDGPPLRYVIREVKRARDTVALQMGLSPEEIPFGVAIQAHVYKDKKVPGHKPMGSLESMREAFSMVSQQIGHLYIIEVGVMQASPNDTAVFLHDVITAATEAKADGIHLWLGTRLPYQPEPGWFDPSLSLWISKGTKISPSFIYYSLMASLYSLIQEK
jgi:hypothetical protein